MGEGKEIGFQTERRMWGSGLEEGWFKGRIITKKDCPRIPSGSR